MSKFTTRFILIIFVLGAFIGPFAAIVTIEKSKRAEKLVAEQQSAAQAQKEAATIRYQYYLDVNDRRNNLKQAMADAKAQYDELIKQQPGLVKEKQKTINQTVIKPVVTQKVVEQKVAATKSTSSTSAAKPKSSTKTKTS